MNESPKKKCPSLTSAGSHTPRAKKLVAACSPQLGAAYLPTEVGGGTNIHTWGKGAYIHTSTYNNTSTKIEVKRWTPAETQPLGPQQISASESSEDKTRSELKLKDDNGQRKNCREIAPSAKNI